MKMTNQIILVILGYFVATLLGVYAQDTTYYFIEQFPTLNYQIPLTIATLLSILLYILIPVALYKRANRKLFIASLIGTCIIGIPTSMFSLFVWGMSM